MRECTEAVLNLMSNVEDYKKQVRKQILENIELLPEVVAAWEGGSAANGSGDQYSDIDLCLLTRVPLQAVLNKVESLLQKFEVIHKWQPSKSAFGDGIIQSVFVLNNAPQYFFVDVAVFDQAFPQLLKDFLEIERHGRPIIYFDKENAIKPGHTDAEALFKRQQIRVNDLKNGFPIFKTLVLKEIDRGLAIDAIGFYQNGLVRPLIEVLGMIYCPYTADFGMRYIHKTFPLDQQKLIEDLNYVSKVQDLHEKIAKAEKAFEDAVRQVQSRSHVKASTTQS